MSAQVQPQAPLCTQGVNVLRPLQQAPLSEKQKLRKGRDDGATTNGDAEEMREDVVEDDVVEDDVVDDDDDDDDEEEEEEDEEEEDEEDEETGKAIDLSDEV